MKLTWHEDKRAETLQNRSLDFADAGRIFDGLKATWVDDRFDYGGEVRQITAGWLDERMVMVVWTQRGDIRHIISMRHCHDKEVRKIKGRFDDL